MTTLDLRSTTKSQLRAVPQALRAHQWVKNLLVFVPVLLDHKIFDPLVLSKAMVAFAAFATGPSAIAPSPRSS